MSIVVALEIEGITFSESSHDYSFQNIDVLCKTTCIQD